MFKKKKKKIQSHVTICFTVKPYPLCAGIDFKIRTIELDGKRVKLQIW